MAAAVTAGILRPCAVLGKKPLPSGGRGKSGKSRQRLDTLIIAIPTRQVKTMAKSDFFSFELYTVEIQMNLRYDET